MTESIEQIQHDAAATIAAEQEALRAEGRQQLAEELRRRILAKLDEPNLSVFFNPGPGLAIALGFLNQLQPAEKTE